MRTNRTSSWRIVRYNTPLTEVIKQIGADACKPKNLQVQIFAPANLQDNGEEMQQAAMERVASKKQGARRKLAEDGITDQKVLNRSAYKTATHAQAVAPEASSLDVMFSSIGALMNAEAKRQKSNEVKMHHEATLLNIEKIQPFGALLQLPGTTPQFVE